MGATPIQTAATVEGDKPCFGDSLAEDHTSLTWMGAHQALVLPDGLSSHWGIFPHTWDSQVPLPHALGSFSVTMGDIFNLQERDLL